jgi:diacylglycerol kinase (ATP)
MKFNKILLAINPKSGADDHELSSFKERVEELFPTQEIGMINLKDNKDIRYSCILFNPDLVIIGGGDGTLKKVVQVLTDLDLIFAVLPLGSANGFAKCIQIHQLEDAFEVLKTGQIYQVDGVYINDQLSLHLADFGFNANLIQNFEEEEGRGMLTYFKSAAPEILNLQSHPFRMEIDGKVLEFSAKILVIANGDRYGTGAQINPGGELGDGFVDIIALDPEVLGDYLSLSLAFFSGALKVHKSAQHWRTTFCKIYNLNYAAFQIDGDSQGSPAEVIVKVIPSQFKFLVPKKDD